VEVKRWVAGRSRGASAPEGGCFYFACGFAQSFILLSRVFVALRASDAVSRFCMRGNLRGWCVAGSFYMDFLKFSRLMTDVLL